MRKVWIIIAVALFSASVFGSPLEREFKTDKGKKLTVDLNTGGSVKINGWDKDVIAVNVDKRHGDLDDVDIRFDEHNGDLDIDVPHGDSRGNLRFTISVPATFDIEVETMGGDIEITGVSGSFSGKTMGGDLEFKDLKGRLEFVTMGGKIKLSNSRVDGSLKTMGGKVLFDDVVGDIKGTSMGGDVIYRNVTGKDGKIAGSEVNITTMGGDIEVDEAGEGADLHTMGGSISVKKAGQFVKAKTMGGSIDIEEIDGWVKATTMGGDVTVTMTGDPEKGKRDVELSSMGGEIELTLPAGISADFDIQLTYTRNSSKDFKINSDFKLDITESEEWIYDKGSPRKVISGKGKSGSGKHRIRIETINGDITIKKGK